jgi:hypothetical protein
MKTATKVKDLQTHRLMHSSALYRLSDRLKGFDYVVVSAVVNPLCYETYIFGSDKNGEVLEWGELPGSECYVYSHEKALNNAGYEVK